LLLPESPERACAAIGVADAVGRVGDVNGVGGKFDQGAQTALGRLQGDIGGGQRFRSLLDLAQTSPHVANQ